MVYINSILLLFLLIQFLRITFLRRRYGDKKGDFIAMTLMLSTIPFILLSNVAESMGYIFQWLMVLSVIINWIYSLYIFKSSENK